MLDHPIFISAIVGILVSVVIKIFQYRYTTRIKYDSYTRQITLASIVEEERHKVRAELQETRTRYHELANEHMRARLQAMCAGEATVIPAQAVKKPSGSHCVHCGAYGEQERCAYCGCKL